MVGIKVKRQGEMYLMEFSTYDNMLKYLYQNRPSQFSLAFDGEETTGSTPVLAYRVKEDNE